MVKIQQKPILFCLLLTLVHFDSISGCLDFGGNIRVIVNSPRMNMETGTAAVGVGSTTSGRSRNTR